MSSLPDTRSRPPPRLFVEGAWSPSWTPHSVPVPKNVFVQPALSDIPGAKAKQDISMINVLFMAMADDRRMSIDQHISRPVPPIPCKSLRYLMLALGLMCTALGSLG
jgi:hypothetical protein